MSKQTEALKLALEALEYIDRQDNDRDFLSPEECCDLDDAITAIREALAEQPAQQQEPSEYVQKVIDALYENSDPVSVEAAELLEQMTQQQEPVAWMYQCSADSSGPVLMQHKRDWAESGSGLWTETPLYTSPPAQQREFVGLTDDGIESAMPGGIYDCLGDPWDCGVGDGDYMRSIKKDVLFVARAAIAAYEEKNGITGEKA